MLRRLLDHISDSKDRHEIIDLLDKNDLSSEMNFERKNKDFLMIELLTMRCLTSIVFTSFPIFEILHRNGVYPRDVSFIRICQYNEIYDASKISDSSLCQEIENLFNVHEFRYRKIRDKMLIVQVMIHFFSKDICIIERLRSIISMFMFSTT